MKFKFDGKERGLDIKELIKYLEEIPFGEFISQKLLAEAVNIPYNTIKDRRKFLEGHIIQRDARVYYGSTKTVKAYLK